MECFRQYILVEWDVSREEKKKEIGIIENLRYLRMVNKAKTLPGKILLQNNVSGVGEKNLLQMLPGREREKKGGIMLNFNESVCTSVVAATLGPQLWRCVFVITLFNQMKVKLNKSDYYCKWLGKS